MRIAIGRIMPALDQYPKQFRVPSSRKVPGIGRSRWYRPDSIDW